MKHTKIWILIILFSIIYSLFSVVRHVRLETDIFDLGYYDQLIWLYGRGIFYTSVLEAHPWVDHFTPSLALLSPLFIIWDSPIILLIFQSVFICLGSYPIYKLALKKLKRNDTALVISFAY